MLGDFGKGLLTMGWFRKSKGPGQIRPKSAVWCITCARSFFRGKDGYVMCPDCTEKALREEYERAREKAKARSVLADFGIPYWKIPYAKMDFSKLGEGVFWEGETEMAYVMVCPVCGHRVLPGSLAYWVIGSGKTWHCTGCGYEFNNEGEIMTKDPLGRCGVKFIGGDAFCDKQKGHGGDHACWGVWRDDKRQYATIVWRGLEKNEGETMKCKCGNELFWSTGKYCPECGAKLEPDYVELSFGDNRVIRVTDGPSVFTVDTSRQFSGPIDRETLKAFCKGVMGMLGEGEKPNGVFGCRAGKLHVNPEGENSILFELGGHSAEHLTPDEALKFAGDVANMAVEMGAE